MLRRSASGRLTRSRRIPLSQPQFDGYQYDRDGNQIKRRTHTFKRCQQLLVGELDGLLAFGRAVDSNVPLRVDRCGDFPALIKLTGDSAGRNSGTYDDLTNIERPLKLNAIAAL